MINFDSKKDENSYVPQTRVYLPNHLIKVLEENEKESKKPKVTISTKKNVVDKKEEKKKMDEFINKKKKK